MSTQLLRAGRVLTPDGEVEDGWVLVNDARVEAVGTGEPPVPSHHQRRYAVLVPGLVDIHCHGGGGASFADGADAALQVRRAHLHHGTTTLVASLVTDTTDQLVEQVRALRPLVESGELHGIHLEGPWLGDGWHGAHPPELLRDPTPEQVTALADAAGEALVMVTLAPERAGALQAVEELSRRGIRVGAGHTGATYEQARAAVEAGVTVATHLYNAMRTPHHREPGAALALLEDDRVWVESVVDGEHLHPAVVRETARRTGDRWLLVSDAMSAALAGDGEFRLGRLAVKVAGGVARLADGTLAGSTLSLDRAVRTAVSTGVPLARAVHAATAAPAAAMGWADRGRIQPGARADLAALDEHLEVQGVMLGGRWVER